MTDKCSHYWIPAKDAEGNPDFRLNRQMSSDPLVNVTCKLCNCRTWFTEKQWQAIPAISDPTL